MQVLRSPCGAVAKYIHEDGSETAIKTTDSAYSRVGSTGVLEDQQWVNRQKVSVVLSSSLGCFMQCAFCHLTEKKAVYRKLSAAQVVENAKAAILAEVECQPSIRERYVKLCFMGMGDALHQPELVCAVTYALLDWLLSEKLVKGLDGVDLSTVMPPVGPFWAAAFQLLNRDLQRYPRNPETASADRSLFRLFYSLHSASQGTRDALIPRALPLVEAAPILRLLQGRDISIIVHHMFMAPANCSEAEIEALIAFMATQLPGAELRLLPFNAAEGSCYTAWPLSADVLARLRAANIRVKVQHSPGESVSASCGQFLVTRAKPSTENQLPSC